MLHGTRTPRPGAGRVPITYRILNKVVRVGPKDMVVFSYSAHCRGPRHLARLNTHLAGAEAAVAMAGVWNVRMEELADVLNRYRDRHGAV